MTKKYRKNLANLIAGTFAIIAFYFNWIVFKNSSVYWIFGILIAFFVIEKVVYSMLPEKKAKKITPKKKQMNKKDVENISPNRLRVDSEIINSNLEGLSWREFERLCFLYFKAKGYKPQETAEGADGGVDLIIYNRYHKAKEAIQIKHYIHSGNQITVKEIRELHSAKRNHNCPLSTFISTSRFTKTALKQADQYKMECRDIHWVNNKIVKWQELEREKVVG